MFSMFLSSRAVPATPGERLGASTEHLPETCSLRAILRRSASPPWLTRLRLSSLRATARGFAAGGLPTSRHAGPASAGHLATSRRGPRFPTAQRFIGVGSFHPTRNTPLHGAPIYAARLASTGARDDSRAWRRALQASSRKAASRSTSNAASSAFRRRRSASISAVGQLPRCTQMTLGGNPSSRLR